MSTLLIVDDNKSLRKVFVERLREIGYDVFEAADGIEGLAMTREYHPDLIISDIMMPNMDGNDFFTTLQSESPEMAAIPFIFLTALVGEQEMINGLRLGVDGYLAKPVKFDLLSATIKSRLGHQTRRFDLMKSKLDTVFQHIFENQDLSVGEYKSLDTLCEHYLDMASSVAQPSVDFKLAQNVSFHVRTLDEAKQLSSVLANMCPEPESAVIGISEMIINGIEHGNLGIGYKLKTKLLRDETWMEEVKRRLEKPENSKKYVSVSAKRTEDGTEFEFEDFGEGFKSSRYRNFDPHRSHDLHGRGIALADVISFDELRYEGSGNRAIAFIRN